MGADTGNYSRLMYNEEKNYVGTRTVQGIPWVDADSNDGDSSNVRQHRRIEQLLGDGAVGDGFKCTGSGLNNDFNVLGGDGTDDGAGRFFLKGLGCMLKAATTFKNNGATIGGQSLQPRVTSITYNVGPNTTTIIDSAANWGVNEHAAKTLTPDITQPGSTYLVVSNTQRVMTVTGDATAVAQVGDNYRIELKTPVGSDRNDGVYLNVYLDEYDCTDDPNLIHNLTVQTCAQLRTKLIQALYIQEGAENFTDYVDGDGKQHYVFQIARIHRYDGVDAIWDIDDLRSILSDGTGIYPELIAAGNNLRVVQQSPLSNMVNVLPGKWTLSDRSAIKKLVSTTASPAFPAIATPGNVRYDLLSIADDSTLQRKAGTEVALPGDPFTDGPGPDNDKLALAFIRVTETGAVIVTQEDITDVREFLNIGMGAFALANYDSALWLRPHPQSPVDNTLRIESGKYMSSAGSAFINKATAFSSAPFAPITTPGNVRYDLVAMNDAGASQVTVGTEVAGPGDPFVNAPAPISNRLSVAIVRITETASVNIDTADVTDVREYLNKGNGNNVSSFKVQGNPAMTGPITLIPGTNVSMTQNTGLGEIIVNATGGGGGGGILFWHKFPAVTVAQTLFTLPFSYIVGTHQLIVIRNGQYQLVGTDYTETSTTQITLATPIKAVTEEIIVYTITAGVTPSGGSGMEFLPDSISDFYFDDTDTQSALNVELWMMQPAVRFNSDSARVTWFNFEKNSLLGNTQDIAFDLWYALTSSAPVSSAVKLTLDYWVIANGTIPNILAPTGTFSESVTVSSIVGNTPRFQILSTLKVSKSNFATTGTAQRIVCRLTRNITGASLPDYVGGAFDVLSLVPKLV
jgi:hypothetical protein